MKDYLANLINQQKILVNKPTSHLTGETQVYIKVTEGVAKQDKRLFTEPCVTGVKYLGVYF